MSLEQQKGNLNPAMETSLRLPEPNSNGRFRAHSCIALGIEDPDTLERQRCKILGKKRSRSDSSLQNNKTNDTRSESCSLEILYKTTDTVLIICAALFIISSITSVILWLYGIPWVDLVVNKFHFKP